MRVRGRLLLIIFLITILCFITQNNINAQSNNIVSINQTEYESLQVALQNAKVGDTITILQDFTVTESEAFIANLPENSILNLNGHTITVQFMALIFTGKNITIRNGNFSSNASYSFWIGDEEETNNVTIENITTNGGINIYNATDVIIKDTNAVGHDFYSVWIDNGASAIIESGNYSTQGSNGLLGISQNNDKEHPLQVFGGTFITNNNKFAVGSPNLPPEVLGGRFNTDVSDYLAEGYKCEFVDGYFVVGKIQYKQEVVIEPSEINNGENEIIIEVKNTEENKNVLLESLNKSDEIDSSNKDVKVVLDINSINVGETVEQSIIKKLTDTYGVANVADYFDISIKVIDIDTNSLIGTLSNLTKKLKFDVALSKELRNIKDGYKRIYYVVRKHGNEIEILDTVLSEDGSYISFEADKFSTYALAYIDKAIESNNTNISNDEKNVNDIENPETGDENINIYAILAIISLICIYMCKKKILEL